MMSFNSLQVSYKHLQARGALCSPYQVSIPYRLATNSASFCIFTRITSSFQFLIGQLQTLVYLNIHFVLLAVSIPYRLATNQAQPYFPHKTQKVSIPYRLATNFFQFASSIFFHQFQFLIGQLQTSIHAFSLSSLYCFNSLQVSYKRDCYSVRE